MRTGAERRALDRGQCDALQLTESTKDREQRLGELAQFDAPEQFRLDRSTGKGHMTFGKGLHFCLGAPLARLEASTVLRLLLDRTTWFDATEVGPWLPSVLARRREYLQLSVR